MAQRELYPRIGTLSRVASRCPVGVGGNDADVVQDQDGVLWVRKREREAGFEEMLAESMGYMLGTVINAPVPEVRLCLDRDECACLSRMVLGAPLGWNPAFADQVINCDQLGAMVVLDIITMNADRHGANLLLEAAPDELNIRAWAIDNGAAILRHPGQYSVESQRNRLPHTRQYVTGLPLRAMRVGALDAANKAAALDDSILRGMCAEACGLTGMDQYEQSLFQTLRSRCLDAPVLLPEFLAMLEAR